MKDVLVVVPCGQRTIWDEDPSQGPAAARNAYVGTPFKVNRSYADRFTERWVILSAKYSRISPDFLIDGPYNVTFKRASTGPVSVPTLREQIHRAGLHCFGVVIGLGGEEYRAMLTAAFSSHEAKLVFPFAGLPIGKAMQATKRAIELGQPLPQLVGVS
jgi:hypothetical protein